MTAHDLADLGAHALGLLSAAEVKVLESHLAQCPDCRRESDELRATASVIAAVPPETFISEPPGSDLALHRTLRQIRKETGSPARGDHLLRAVAAAAVVVTALLGAAAIGRTTAPALEGPAATASTRVGEGSTGAITMAASVTPAEGWVRVAAEVSGIPTGQRCSLVVVDRDGSQHVAASWVVGGREPGTGTTVYGSAIVAPEQVARVAVRNSAGSILVAVPV